MNTIKRTQVILGDHVAVEYYRDSDNSSGYGDNAQVAYWHGSLRDAPMEPSEDDWMPILPDNSPDPFDLACERLHDSY